MATTVRLEPATEQRLDQLAQLILRYLNRLVQETSDPRERGSGLRANLAGLWPYRVGDDRVICSFEDHELVMLVLQIGHRRDVYQ